MNLFFSFFNRKLKTKALPFDFLDLDIHNHILPGLDDGPQDAKISISLLVELKKLGFSKVISSPRTINQQFPNTSKSILRRYSAFISTIDLTSRLLPTYCPPVSIYDLDNEFSINRESDNLLTTLDNYILVHFSVNVSLRVMEAEIIELIYAGYKPILIEPERYTSLHGNVTYYETLVNRGCYLGLNLLCLQGHYGKAVQKMVFKLLENQLYAFAGTGIVDKRHIVVLTNLAKDSRLLNKIVNYPFLNSLLSEKY